MKRLIFTLVLGLAAMAAQPAHAVLITRNVGLDNLGTAATLNSVSITNLQNGDASNSINVSLSVLELGVPFTVGFTVDETAFVGPTPEVNTYTVTVSLQNAIPRPGVPTGRPINGFDVNVSPSPNVPTLVNVAATPPIGTLPTSDTFAVESPNLANGFRFGGLSGGGGELYFGQTAVSIFTLASTSLGNGSGNFGLQFTANPEPASLLLGSLLLGPAGLIAARRRRKQQAEPSTVLA